MRTEANEAPRTPMRRKAPTSNPYQKDGKKTAKRCRWAARRTAEHYEFINALFRN